MARCVFYSFHYEPDNWRASQVRNMGVIDGNRPTTDNDWETVKKGGDEAIKRWINGQINGKSCAVVLIGQNTAGRKWITYEIIKAWDEGKGVVGVYVHNLLDANKKQAIKGSNPFDWVTMGGTQKRMSSVVMTYDPPYTRSTDVYDYIKNHLADWVEEAISIRNEYRG